MSIKRHVAASLAYLLFVAGVTFFLLLLHEHRKPQQVKQPDPTPQVEERIAPAQPPPVVNENKNKRQPRRARTYRPKQKALMYEADGNSGPS